jgi:hypothetical protein
LTRSFEVNVQTAPHAVWPASQAVQTPEAHLNPLAQAFPQLPQFVEEVPSTASQPLAVLPSQSPKPAAHA